MSENELHPEVIKFKTFINKHPKLIKEIRKNGKSWQDIFEQWILLGEEDIHWQQYKESSEEGKQEQGENENGFKLNLKPELIKQIMKYAETMDINKLQEQVQQFSKTISTVQEVVGQYQRTSKTKKEVDRPFSWFHD